MAPEPSSVNVQPNAGPANGDRLRFKSELTSVSGTVASEG
jgi:hypothetical protein